MPSQIAKSFHSQNKPVFIVGSGRSGTSLLTWCLGQHPNILPLPETHWIARLTLQMRQLHEFGTAHGRYTHLGALDWSELDFYAAFGRAIDQFIVDTKEPRLRFIHKISAKKQGLSDAQINLLEKDGTFRFDPGMASAKNYQVIRSQDDPKGRWVDGTPENTFYMYGLSLLFPEARFIHLLRDPNEVAKSLIHFSQAGGAGIDRTESVAYSQWHRAVEFAVKGERALGENKVLRINYSDLVQSKDATMRKCLKFLGENFSPDCLLPMKERINSSKTDRTSSLFKPKTRQGKAANIFYKEILSTLPGNVDLQVSKELSYHYEKCADQVNIKHPSGIGGIDIKSMVVGFLRSAFIKFYKSLFERNSN